ncbi:lysine N(6)-hydroxylase/L-ornithine N(5)-oxygenase family protein [Rhizobium paknamense]|uniref:L-ornithine N5-oxygenase n=1 Tax=Rhizobium paknamense TaxID=1206817 RepID=A0ABU0IHQ5_9HYPH|nr:SidA/IucD/PvdA family monooxygenase [Rhizobium paknamense]MDQ0457769.1 L-ornithine N5-oxygenase [Rhizobium paknamense]
MSTTPQGRRGDRASSQEMGEQGLLDVLGIGFGPANLGLAIAMEERNQQLPPTDRLSARFLEAKASFGWHNGMLLPNTTMQISFLKDLVSLRSPTSSYSFLNYLHERQRLSDFINLKTFFPSRAEFYDYLLWAANRVDAAVSYGVQARQIDWNGRNFVVTASNGAEEQVFQARNVVLGMGYQPVLPEGIKVSARIFHNQKLLSNLSQVPARQNKSFLVVGAGQSAAEVVAYLHETYPDAEVHSSLRRFGYSPSDDTPFVNRIFDPASVDEFYSAPADLKERLLAYHWPTNYAAVDADLIEDLYRREYNETLTGQRRLHVHRTTEIEEIEDGADGVRVVLRDLGNRHRKALTVDAVVFATGFKPFDIGSLFGPGLESRGGFENGQPLVNRDYSLDLQHVSGGFFLNGSVEHSHGLTSTLLSNIAIRAAEILQAVTDARDIESSQPRKLTA